jgi:hypothetical protein
MIAAMSARGFLTLDFDGELYTLSLNGRSILSTARKSEAEALFAKVMAA